MNLLLPLLSFLLGNAKNMFKQSGTALSQQMVLHVRAVSIVLITGIGSLVIFCTTLCFLISNVAAQLDQEEGFSFTGSTLVFSITAAISLAVLLFSLRRKTWLNTVGLQQSETKKTTSPIESAIALLIMDFVESRKEQRKESESV